HSHAERRSGGVERDDRTPGSGLLRIYDHSRWRGPLRSLQSRRKAELPISRERGARPWTGYPFLGDWRGAAWRNPSSFLQIRSGGDRKSTRLNSSHVSISYAVFCL